MKNRLQKVTIHWSKPILFENRHNSMNYSEDMGFYLISRKYIRHGQVFEKYIYIGETGSSFENRCNQHITNSSRWTEQSGNKYIRFGKIVRIPPIVDAGHLKEFRLTVESALIQSIKEELGVELVNIRQVNSCQIWYDLKIENTGYRGVLPPIINSRDYYEEDDI